MIQTRLETALFPASSAPSVFGEKITHKRSEQSGLTPEFEPKMAMNSEISEKAIEKIVCKL